MKDTDNVDLILEELTNLSDAGDIDGGLFYIPSNSIGRILFLALKMRREINNLNSKVSDLNTKLLS